MGRLNGRVALVTGGSRGIGYAAAARFIEEGAQVFVMARERASLDASVASLGPRATGICGDASNCADLDRVLAAIAAAARSLDVVFANAGCAAWAPLDSLSEDHYRQVFDANVKSTLFTVQKALPLLHAGSSVILMSSASAAMGTAGLSVYSASKAAVRSLARCWALELKGRRIRVNVLSPGPTRAGALHSTTRPAQFASMVAGLASRIPSGRIAETADVANAALFLASDESSYLNGAELAVDGGFAQI